MDDLLALYVHNGCRFFYNLNCNMILIFKSRISQNFVVIRLQVFIVNLWTFQSFPFSGLNFNVNIFIFSSLMTSNILYKMYFKSKKKVKFLLSNCCNKGRALFLSTTVGALWIQWLPYPNSHKFVFYVNTEISFKALRKSYLRFQSRSLDFINDHATLK